MKCTVYTVQIVVYCVHSTHHYFNLPLFMVDREIIFYFVIYYLITYILFVNLQSTFVPKAILNAIKNLTSELLTINAIFGMKIKFVHICIPNWTRNPLKILCSELQSKYIPAPFLAFCITS